MSQPASKATEKWTALLQKALGRSCTEWKPGQLTFDEVGSLRKAQKMPHSRGTTHRWLAGEIKAGRVKKISGFAVGPKGKLYRETRYEVA
jgi:hypothetical protein